MVQARLGQFQIFYMSGADHLEYQPDFVAETKDCIYMLEPKMRKEMDDVDVLAKKDAAIKWCSHATDHAKTSGGKPWKYALIPHDGIAENMTIARISEPFCRELSGSYELSRAVNTPARDAPGCVVPV